MIQPVVRSKRYRNVFLALSAFTGSYFFFDYGLPQLKAVVGDQAALAKENSSHIHCLLSNESCAIGGANIKLDRNIIRPMEAAKIEIEWPSLPSQAETLELTLEGQEMMMGVYRQKLIRQTGTNLYSGELVLPFCVSDEMTWQGKIAPPANNSQQPVYVSIRMIK